MDFIVDVENKRLVSNFRSTRTISPESAVFGDKPDISVRLVESNDTSGNFPFRYVDLTGTSIRVAIGQPGGDASSGTFTLTFDGDTTSALDYNATASDVDTALNALASMVTAGGCTVSAVGAGYQVAFDTTGAQTLITSTTDSLFPATSAYIYEATAGDGSTNEVQVVTLEVDNAAYVELTSDISAPSATVTVVREGVTDTTSELQRVEIDGDPYLGTWAVTINGNTSAAISVDATLAEITTAIEGITGIGAGNVVVTGSVLDFTLQFDSSLGNVATASIDVANLTGSIGKTGSLDLNTNQFLELLNGSASTSATLEIVKYDTGNSTSDTVFQGAIACVQDVIPNTPVSTTPFPSYASASHTHTESDITDLGTYSTASSTETLTNKTFDANGTGNSLSNVDVADLSATGTPSGTTYLRGDNTWATVATGAPEGTAVLSTGETGGTKYLREDGDGTCSWQAIAGGGDFKADGTVAMTGELDLGANSIGGTAQSATGDGTTTIDWGAGNVFNFLFQHATNETFTFTAPSKPGLFVLKLAQTPTPGACLASWPVTVRWPSGTAPTLSTGTSQVDIVRFYYDGANYYGTYDLNFS